MSAVQPNPHLTPPGRPKPTPTSILTLPAWLQLDLGYTQEAPPPPAGDEDNLSWLDEIASGFGAPLEEPPSTTPWQPLETAPAGQRPATPPVATETTTLPPIPPPTSAADDVLAALDRRPKERLATTPGDDTHIDLLEILEGERQAPQPDARESSETNIDILAVLEAEIAPTSPGQPAGAPTAHANPQARLGEPQTDTDPISDAEEIASILAVLGADTSILRAAPPAPEGTPPPTPPAPTPLSEAPPTLVSRRPREAASAASEPSAAAAPGETPPLPAESTSVIVANLANQIPDDPDEAIAWLERMAQESSERPARSPRPPLKATPPTAEVTGRRDKDTAATFEADIPDNLDDALAWLDELVAADARRDALDDPTDIIELPTPDVAVATLEPLVDLSPPPATPPIARPDDLDDALAWLDQIAAQDNSPLPALAVDTEPTSGSASEVPPTPSDAVEAAMDSGDITAIVTAFDAWLGETTALDEVIAQAQAALVQHPQAIQLYRVLGDAQQQQGDMVGAAATYRQALLQALAHLTSPSP